MSVDPDPKDGKPNGDSGGDSGGDKGTGKGAGTGDTGKKPETYSADDLAREVDRRVNEAHKKWKSELDAVVAKKDSDAEAKLSELQKLADDASSRAAFLEKAVEAGVADIKAAFVVAKEYKYWDGEKLDIDTMRKNHPGLFGAEIRTAGKEGGATGGDAPKSVDDFIRGSTT